MFSFYSRTIYPWWKTWCLSFCSIYVPVLNKHNEIIILLHIQCSNSCTTVNMFVEKKTQIYIKIILKIYSFK